MGTVLGESRDEAGNLVTAYTVTDGQPNPCEQVWSMVKQSDGNGGYIQGYADTDNDGNVYQLEVCADAEFTESRCKYDNFKVRKSNDVPPPEEYGVFTVDKFFDANGNGARDFGEKLISGWGMTLNELLPSLVATKSTPNASWNNLPEAVYSVTEGLTPSSLGGTWYISYKGSSTGLKSDNQLGAAAPLATASEAIRTIPNIDVAAGTAESRLFGNYCTTTSTGGWTLGFWSNQNGGQQLFNSNFAWRTHLNGVSLYGASGPYSVPSSTAFSKPGWPTTVAKLSGTAEAFNSFRVWILGANSASNTDAGARYMLSAQLAAMILNVNVGNGTSVDVNAFIPAFGGTVTQLMDAAKSALADPTYKPASFATARDYQIWLKNFLDALNNNRATVIPTNACGASLIAPTL
jgi:hypothetical protein